MPLSNSGHRKRLLDRFENSGLKGFHDYEILELLLTFVISRKDTKPVAKKLLKHYKSVSAVLHARPVELKRIEGLGEKSALFLSLLKEILAYCLCEKYEKQSIVSKRNDVEEYLKFHFGMRKDEYVAVLFLDNGNHVIATEEIIEGTVNQCVVYPRTIFEKAMNHGASSIILAHNHPGGSLIPSEADWTITKKLHSAGIILEISLLDHIIVVRDEIVSLREMTRWPGK